MTARVRSWYECNGDPCTCTKPATPVVRALPDPALRAEVARIAASCEAIAAMPAENGRAVRCLQAVATSLRIALEMQP